MALTVLNMPHDLTDHGRALMLVDPENLLGGGSFRAAQLATIRRPLLAAAGVGRPQVVVAASSGRGAVEAGLGWPGSRLVWRPGRDGADLALADVALNEDVVARYQRVVICSGDGLFAVVANYLGRHGVHVSVIAPRGGLSNRLAQVAAEVHVLDWEMGWVA
jgi:hypothetical protein